ncbi:MAG: hypothetical protein MHM6MM_003135 [Cercozoa sp. M6MM]
MNEQRGDIETGSYEYRREETQERHEERRVTNRDRDAYRYEEEEAAARAKKSSTTSSGSSKSNSNSSSSSSSSDTDEEASDSSLSKMSPREQVLILKFQAQLWMIIHGLFCFLCCCWPTLYGAFQAAVARKKCRRLLHAKSAPDGKHLSRIKRKIRIAKLTFVICFALFCVLALLGEGYSILTSGGGGSHRHRHH